MANVIPAKQCQTALQKPAGDSSLLTLTQGLLNSHLHCVSTVAGRFKDEARHQQRLSDMRERCNALFDGVIRDHFQVCACHLAVLKEKAFERECIQTPTGPLTFSVVSVSE